MIMIMTMAMIQTILSSLLLVAPTNAPMPHSLTNVPTDATTITTTTHPQVNNDDIKTHKEFLIQFINSLIHRAKNENTKHLITSKSTPGVKLNL
mmetsp:Transcript_34680/g.35272  ORF Transcript_34680/g.35272 Transcript_34680/m.35272 type:complete len:94 (+) Transcript_34680:66-347(+)